MLILLARYLGEGVPSNFCPWPSETVGTVRRDLPIRFETREVDADVIPVMGRDRLISFLNKVIVVAEGHALAATVLVEAVFGWSTKDSYQLVRWLLSHD